MGGSRMISHLETWGGKRGKVVQILLTKLTPPHLLIGGGGGGGVLGGPRIRWGL